MTFGGRDFAVSSSSHEVDESGSYPFRIGFRRFHCGLDESEAFDAVFDGREVDALRRLLPRARRFDRKRDLRIDVGKAFEIAFRMTRRHAHNPRRRIAQSGPPRVTMRVDFSNGDHSISFGLACTQWAPPLVP